MQNLPFFNNLCFKCPNYIVKNLFCQAYDKNCVLVNDCDYYNNLHLPENKPLNPVIRTYDWEVNPEYPLGPSDKENKGVTYTTTTTQPEDNCKVSLEYEDGVPVLYGIFTKEDLKLEWKV